MILCRVIVAQSNDLNKKQQTQKIIIPDDLDSDDEEYLEEKYRQIFQKGAVYNKQMHRYLIKDPNFLIYPEYLMVCRVNQQMFGPQYYAKDVPNSCTSYIQKEIQLLQTKISNCKNSILMPMITKNDKTRFYNENLISRIKNYVD